MDIQSLKAFKAIAELSSFSAAAETLCITQPAISKRIATLEDKLGVSLFNRVSRQVKLSQAGAILLPKANHIIREMEDAERTLSHYGEENIGVLQLGISHHIGLHRLPPILKAFSKKYPRVKLDLSFVDSEAGFEGVLNGDLELGLVTLPFNKATDLGLTSQEVWHDPLVFTINKDHPLAQEKKVALNDLIELEAILPKTNTFTYQIVQRLFSKNNLNLSSSINTNNLESIRMMVSIGLGWSVLPKILVDGTPEAQNIKTLDIPMPIDRSLGYVMHSKRPLSNAAKRMVDLLKNHRH